MIRQKCEVLAARKAGIYHTIQMVAPEIAEEARPGQFVQVAVESGHEFLLRRPFSIAQASRRGGFAGTIEIVFQPKGGGTNWLTQVRAHDFLDVIGPLGNPFPYPRDLSNCLLVGGGYGAAPLFFLADELRARGKRVDMILGARSHDRLYNPTEGKRRAVSVTITTDDGSLGDRGRVTDALPTMISKCGTEVVYACGPNPMLRGVAEYCLTQGIPTQVSVEELMACGVGVCWTCVVPVVRKGGKGWDNLRSCLEGPVFNGGRIWWDKWLGTDGGPVHTPPYGFRLEEAAVTPSESWPQ